LTDSPCPRNQNFGPKNPSGFSAFRFFAYRSASLSARHRIEQERRFVNNSPGGIVRAKDPQGKVEQAMLAFIKARLETGVLSVTEEQILAAIIPPDQPKLRFRPAYRYGLSRLRVRHVVNAVTDRAGVMRYFIGDYPSRELRESLGL